MKKSEKCLSVIYIYAIISFVIIVWTIRKNRNTPKLPPLIEEKPKIKQENYIDKWIIFHGKETKNFDFNSPKILQSGWNIIFLDINKFKKNSSKIFFYDTIKGESFFHRSFEEGEYDLKHNIAAEFALKREASVIVNVFSIDFFTQNYFDDLEISIFSRYSFVEPQFDEDFYNIVLNEEDIVFQNVEKYVFSRSFPSNNMVRIKKGGKGSFVNPDLKFHVSEEVIADIYFPGTFWMLFNFIQSSCEYCHLVPQLLYQRLIWEFPQKILYFNRKKDNQQKREITMEIKKFAHKIYKMSSHQQELSLVLIEFVDILISEDLLGIENKNLLEIWFEILWSCGFFNFDTSKTNDLTCKVYTVAEDPIIPITKCENHPFIFERSFDFSVSNIIRRDVIDYEEKRLYIDWPRRIKPEQMFVLRSYEAKSAYTRHLGITFFKRENRGDPRIDVSYGSSLKHFDLFLSPLPTLSSLKMVKEPDMSQKTGDICSYISEKSFWDSNWPFTDAPQRDMSSIEGEYSPKKSRLNSKREAAIFEISREMGKFGRHVEHFGKILNNKEIPSTVEFEAQESNLEVFDDPLIGGSLSSREKHLILGKYKFYFAFEDYISEEDYVTEEIWDALVSGAVPVFLGATNVEKNFPFKDAFINARDFELDKLAYLIFFFSNPSKEEKYLEYHKWRKKEWPKWFEERLRIYAKKEETCRMCNYYYTKFLPNGGHQSDNNNFYYDYDVYKKWENLENSNM